MNKRTITERMNKQSVFPEKIGSFTFVEEILTEKYPKPYAYGLYKNNKGTKAFAKVWQGRRKDIRYTFLLNELRTYQLLWRVLRKHPSIKKRYPNITIPELLGYKQSDNILVVLLALIDGELLAYVSESTRLRVFKDMFGFLDTVNVSIRKNDMSNLLKRQGLYWVMILPYVSLRALFRNPSEASTILRAVVKIVLSIPVLLSTKETAFVHRDLANWNIKVHKKQLYLYDFQLSSMAHPLLEYAVTTLKLWENKTFAEKVFETVVLPKITTKRKRIVFQSLSLCLALYDLGLADGGSRKAALDYIHFNLSESNFTKSSSIRTFVEKVRWHLDLFWRTPKDYLYSYSYSTHTKPDITDFNPDSKKIGETFKRKIKRAVPSLTVDFVGSASFGIMGEKDIDILAACAPSQMKTVTRKLSKLLGEPVKVKPFVVEWTYPYKNASVEVTLFDKTHPLYIRKIAIYRILVQDKNVRKQYAELKKRSKGQSMREYDRSKLHFFTKLRNEWQIV